MPIRLEGMTLYTVKDIEELLGVGNSTVRRYISEGRLQGRKMARRWYIPAENLLEYFRSTSQEPPEELLEKLKELEEKLDQKENKTKGKQISLARISSSKSKRKSAAQTPQPPPAITIPTHPPALSPLADQTLSEVEQLLRQARRLKEEAARIERIYVKPDQN